VAAHGTNRSGETRAAPLGVAAILAAIVGFSFLNLIVKISHADALIFAFYRLWLGAGLMVAVSLVTGRTDWRRFGATVPGGILFAINIITFFAALKRTAVADVLIITALQPALTLLVAGPLFGERVTRRDAAWTLGGVAGIVLVTVGASGSPVWSLGGDVLAVASLAAFTVYFLLSKRVRTRLSAVEWMTGVTCTAAVVATPAALLSGASFRLRPVDVVLLVLFVLGAQGGHVMLAWAHEYVDVSVSSLLILVEPIVSAVAAFFVLSEPLTALEIVGGIVAVGSMAAVVSTAARVVAEPLAPPEPPA
jgi:drug/metabolite transporter (DMT)-like permease